MDRADYWTTVRRQDESLATTIAVATRALAGAALPTVPAGGLLGVVAMGASTMAAELLVHEARQRDRVVLNWPASDWRALPEPMALPVIGISESGRSPETIDALERCSGHRIVITNVAGSPVTAPAETVVPLGGIADAGVYVSGYTSTLAALALTGERLGLAGLTEGLGEVPALVRSVLATVFAAVDGFLERSYSGSGPAGVECVGAGAGFAAAAETALLVREAGRTPSAFFQTDQYLHGPAEAAPGAFCAVVFGNGRADELVEVLLTAGVPVLHVAVRPAPGAAGVRLPEAAGVPTAILQVLVGQVLAGRLGDRSGHELGTFRHEFADTKLPSG